MATHTGVMPILSSWYRPARAWSRVASRPDRAVTGAGVRRSAADAQMRRPCTASQGPGDLMAHPDLEGWGICLAPPHRRLRDPAIASWMADTATTARPRSRRRTVVADNPLGSSPPDRKEVLHHRGRSDHTPLGRPLGWAVQTSLLQDAGFQPF